MDFASIKTVTAIMAICFLAGLYGKKLGIDKWIPCIVGTLGGILGVVGMYVIPEFPAGNWLDAIAVGIASGLAATGAHQVYKQLYNKPSITIPAIEPESAVFCLNCGKKCTYTVKNEPAAFLVHGKEIECEEMAAYCDECGEPVYVPAINDANVAARSDAYVEAVKE